jgi:hypothetical protein
MWPHGWVGDVGTWGDGTGPLAGEHRGAGAGALTGLEALPCLMLSLILCLISSILSLISFSIDLYMVGEGIDFC